MAKLDLTPADPDLRQVRFHVDYGSPGGFAGTIIEDPTPDAGTDPWLFYAEGLLIARADATSNGWQLQVIDREFTEAHQMTTRTLVDLFELATTALARLYETFAGPPATSPPEQDPQAAPSVLDVGVVETGPKPNDLVAAPHNGFRLDRGVLAERMDAEGEVDEDAGISGFGETAAEQIAGAVMHAETVKALTVPDGLQLTVLKPVPDNVVLALRETHEAAAEMQQRRRAAGLPAERQVATWHIDTGWLCGGDDGTFGGLCVTLEEVCTLANGLVPSLRALLDGEETLLDLIDEPLTVLSYNSQGRLGSYRSGVEGLTEGDPDQTRSLWPLLILALEAGEASEDWSGDRQRAFQLEGGGERYLARQLSDASARLVREGAATPAQLPEPEDGFAPYLR
jgi:hypothetical protein